MVLSKFAWRGEDIIWKRLQNKNFLHFQRIHCCHRKSQTNFGVGKKISFSRFDFFSWIINQWYEERINISSHPHSNKHTLLNTTKGKEIKAGVTVWYHHHQNYVTEREKGWLLLRKWNGLAPELLKGEYLQTWHGSHGKFFTRNNMLIQCSMIFTPLISVIINK